MLVKPIARRLVSPPSGEPISLETAKKHLLVSHSQDDALITLWIEASRFHAERISGYRFITQQWEFTFARFPVMTGNYYRAIPGSIGDFLIPGKPVQSVDSIVYIDSAGDEQTFGTLSDDSPPGINEYSFLDDTHQPRLALKFNQVWPITAPVTNAVRMTVTLGYGDNAEDVPAIKKAGMLLLIGHLNENREEVVTAQSLQSVQIPMGIRDLLANPSGG